MTTLGATLFKQPLPQNYLNKDNVHVTENTAEDIIDDINDTGETFKFILDKFGKGDGRIKFAALIHNKPSKVTIDYLGYEIDKSKDPAWIVFPWEEWDK